MNTITDQELLTRHLSAHDPAALRELMARHGPMVYATARRLAPGDAEDVTQAVFLLLWQKAAKLKGMNSVAGWLYRATRYACCNANKVRGRREHYEREAAMLRREVTEAAEPRVRALLDEGLSRLGETNRQAVILRYLEGLSAEETAGRLGMTPRAAGKRAERGVEKLRAFMGSKGYSVPAASLAGALAVEAAHALPQAISTGLEQLVAGGVAGGNVASLTVATAKAMIMAKVKTVVVSVGMMALVGIGVVGGVKLMAVSEPATVVQSLPSSAGAQRPEGGTGPTTMDQAAAARKLVSMENADLATILDRMAVDERKLVNLYVEAEAWEEQDAGSDGNWRRTPTDSKVRAWIDGMPGGAARFDVTEHRPWTDGLGPVAESTYTVAWDGKQSRYLLRATGLPGKASATADADISDGVLPLVADRSKDFATGCALSTPLNVRSGSMSLSIAITNEVLTARTVPAHTVSVTPIKRDQTEYLSIRVAIDKSRDKTWVVDPVRGYALITFTATYADGSVAEARALKITQVADGVWWPMAGEVDVRDKGQPPRRGFYRASKVIANDAVFDRSVFTPFLPPGWHVNDKTTGRSYVVPPAIGRVEKGLEKTPPQ